MFIVPLNYTPTMSSGGEFMCILPQFDNFEKKKVGKGCGYTFVQKRYTNDQ